jgi:hypothetical protein
VDVSEAPTSSLKTGKVQAAGVEAGSGHFPVNSGPAEGEPPEGLPRAFCPGGTQRAKVLGTGRIGAVGAGWSGSQPGRSDRFCRLRNAPAAPGLCGVVVTLRPTSGHPRLPHLLVIVPYRVIVLGALCPNHFHVQSDRRFGLLALPLLLILFLELRDEPWDARTASRRAAIPGTEVQVETDPPEIVGPTVFSHALTAEDCVVPTQQISRDRKHGKTSLLLDNMSKCGAISGSLKRCRHGSCGLRLVKLLARLSAILNVNDN